MKYNTGCKLCLPDQDAILGQRQTDKQSRVHKPSRYSSLGVVYSIETDPLSLELKFFCFSVGLGPAHIDQT